MKRLQFLSILGLATVVMPMVANADQVISSFGADYTTGTYAPYDKDAVNANTGTSMQSGDFDNAAPGTNQAPYTIYLASNATYAYIMVQSSGFDNSLSFANIYVDSLFQNVNINGSNLAFELGNSKVFDLNTGASNSLAGTGYDVVVTPGVAPSSSNPNGTLTSVEAEIPWSVFADSQLTGEGFNGQVQFRDSQSFGYTYVGGESFGPNRFGVLTAPVVSTPEPPTLYGGAVAVICAMGLAWRRRLALA